MTKTIVVPLDTSKESEVSLPVAIELAQRTNAKLMLVSVIEAPSEFGVWLRANETIESWVDHHVDVDQYLTGVADGIGGVQVDTLVSTGNPAVEINLIAQDQPEPVIVMASHARTGVSRYAIGSVTASVLHDAVCPVIVARATEQAPEAVTAGRMDRLLVALDGSDFAENALSGVQSVLGTSALNLHLLQVVETTKWYGSTNVDIDYAAFAIYIDAARDTAREYLTGRAKELERAGHNVTWEVRDGLVSEQIIDTAQEFDAGMIVMATHGRTGLGRVFIGSVAERVIHDTDRPVLLVNPHGEGR